MTDDHKTDRQEDSLDPLVSDSLILRSLSGLPNARASVNPFKTGILGSGDDAIAFKELIRDHFGDEDAIRWTVKKVADQLEGGDGAGRVLRSHDYVLNRVIGSGGFGEIWDAVQCSLGRMVAIKYLRKDLFESGQFDDEKGRALDLSFRQEALATANLEHPNIVPIHEVGVDQEGRPLIAMKRVRGRCWQDILDEEFSTLPFPEYLIKHLNILIHVAQAVAFAHSRGVIHRDIKPAQVMVGEFGEVVLMDWGLAVLFDEKRLTEHAPASLGSDLPTLQSASSPAGTLAFMAPEQTEREALRVGPHTDVYLLGGLLYYILTGQTPHDPDSITRAFAQACQGIVRPMLDTPYGDEIPSPLVFLATQAMAVEIEDRTPSAADFITEIQNFLTGAGKREESRVLTESVREQLASKNLQYSDLSDLLSEISQARLLAPDNADAIAAEQDLRRRYAEKALENQDYVLARIQALNIEEERRRTIFLEKAESGERRLNRQNYYQRLLSLLFSLVLVWGGTTIYFIYQDMDALNNQMRTLLEAKEEMQLAKMHFFEVLPLRIRAADEDMQILSLEAGAGWTEFATATRTLMEFALEGSFSRESRIEKSERVETIRAHIRDFEESHLTFADEETPAARMAFFEGEDLATFRAELETKVDEFVSLSLRELYVERATRNLRVRFAILAFAFLAGVMLVFFAMTYMVRRK